MELLKGMLKAPRYKEYHLCKPKSLENLLTSAVCLPAQSSRTFCLSSTCEFWPKQTIRADPTSSCNCFVIDLIIAYNCVIPAWYIIIDAFYHWNSVLLIFKRCLCFSAGILRGRDGLPRQPVFSQPVFLHSPVQSEKNLPLKNLATFLFSSEASNLLFCLLSLGYSVLGASRNIAVWAQFTRYSFCSNCIHLRMFVPGIVALLLSLKKRPVIRYPTNSDLAKRLAFDLVVRYFYVGPRFQ
jgi:hypothetical protein